MKKNSAPSKTHRLRALILSAWPDAETPDYHIRIVPSAKLWTASTKDIDILVLIWAAKPIPVGVDVNGRPVSLRSLSLVVEVKDNADFQFLGNKLWVRYDKVWESTSAQAERQKFAFRNYAGRETGNEPFVYSTIWLLPAKVEDIPEAAINVLPGAASWTDFLRAVVQSNWERLSQWSRPIVDSKLSPTLLDKLDVLFTRRLAASDLDRRKIEEIWKGKLHGQLYDDKMGQQMLLFTGPGGTGKTISLLRTAWDLFDDRDQRVLILTYNHALRADIERLLLLLDMKTGAAGRTIEIRTADKYLKDLLEDFGERLEWVGSEFEVRLSEAVRRTVQTLRKPTDEQKERIAWARSNKAYAWDFVMVDEGQDWPPERRDLLVEFYGATQLVIAVGSGQLVQTNAMVDWTEDVERGKYQKVPLTKSLRLKYNVASFVKAVAHRFGFLKWRLEPDRDVKVGRVIIVVGDHMKAAEQFRQIIRDATDAGNSPVDLLFCVPPEYCDRSNTESTALIASTIRSWGHRTWDGVNECTRKDTFPTSLEDVRIVQYESSRGLEGWAVFLLGLDRFYESKKSQFHPTTGQQGSFFQDGDEAARKFAAQWVMIPLTRAIDTIVIHLSSRDSDLYQVFRDADREAGYFVQWTDPEPVVLKAGNSARP